MCSLTLSSTKELSTPPYTMTIPPSPMPLLSSETTFSSTRCSPNLQSLIYLYRSQRPSTPPCPLPAPLYLSCWWTGDSTDFWGHFQETTSPRYSEPLFSCSWRNNDKPTMETVSRWRWQFQNNNRTVPYPPPPGLIPGPHAPSKLPLLLTPSHPLTLQSTLLPSWPDEPTPSHVAQELYLPFPQENNIVATVYQLNKAGEGLTNKVLLEWALDMLCSLEDWCYDPFSSSLYPALYPYLSFTYLER